MALRRKIEKQLEEYLSVPQNKMLIVDGARQVGKSYIIRKVGQKLFPNYIEVNMERDKQKDRLFAGAQTPEAFYLALSSVAGDKMKECIEKKYFEPFKDYTFEGHRFPGVNDYDGYLTHFYGDYMTPPPVEERGTTHGIEE